jgi:hypothetical protein
MNARIEAASLNEHRSGRRPKLVVVGNGMAGIRAVEELLKLAPDLYDITVFGAEPHPNYNRILLSPVLAGEMTIRTSSSTTAGWYADNGITPAHRQDQDPNRPHRAQGRRQRRHRGRLRPPAAGHRLHALHPADSRQRPARRDQLPRHQGHRRDDRHRRHAQARGGDRRRPARAGSRQRPQAARHGRHRGAPDALADGTPARQGRGRHAEGLARSARPQVPAGEADRSADRGRSRAGSARCASRTAWKFPPTWW